MGMKCPEALGKLMVMKCPEGTIEHRQVVERCPEGTIDHRQAVKRSGTPVNDAITNINPDGVTEHPP